eukprot:TRINITY_DN6355_c0_g3_i1.p3 TRINITY_DN6355_c0_g3~~TRINITY_DN6355_c0_g3_i1.p3  ORF type:complete len:194 (+),score=67.20 TRINITY_DN6355_c0_g3_i1:43-624(+)
MEGIVKNNSTEALKAWEKANIRDASGALKATSKQKDYPDGSKYEGELQNDKRHGKGKLTDPTGIIFAGEFKGDLFITGIVIFPNGERYEGDLVDGKKHGKGTYHHTSGNKYEGQWNEDKRHGRGVFHYAEQKERYEGEWNNGTREGLGTYFFADGRKYVGGWKGDHMNGQGVMTFPDGQKLDTEWVNDQPKSQ